MSKAKTFTTEQVPSQFWKGPHRGVGFDIEALRRLADDDELYSYQRERILAAAKYIQQLERLVCSGITIHDYDGECKVMRVTAVESAVDGYHTREAAIDAAILHMEQEAGDD